MQFNRIGNKLGLVGLVGVALSVGSVVNYRMSQSSLATVDEYRDTQQQISEQALVTAIGFRRVQLLGKDIRYAKNAEDIAKAVTAIPPSKSMYEKAVDTAISLSTDRENKARFERTKLLANDYSLVVDEIAKLATAKFAALGKSNGQSKDWNQKFAALLDSEALKENTNRLAIERELQEANGNFNAVATAGWRFATTGDPALKTVITTQAGKIGELLTRGGLLANDATMRSAVEALGSTAKAFVVSTNELVKLEDNITALIQNRGLPAAAESSDLITAAIAVSRKAVADAKDVATEQLVQANRINLALSVVVVLSIIGSVLFGFWGVARPMTRLNRAMGRMADGELHVVIPGADRGDEVGDMAKTIAVIRDNADRKAVDEAEAKAKQNQIVAEQRKQEMIKLADDFEGAVGRIVQTVSTASTELEASAGTLTTTSARSQELTKVVAAASEETTANVQSVASATEQLTSSVNEISRQVQESARIAGEAVGQARRTNDRVGELSQAASRIGAVVELINTIAGQTNLLALNATIEAARAGDAGRGFAVVASEVKALAEQTAKATDEISQQISGIQTATQDSVAAIKEIGSTIGHMAEIASTIASAVEEQGAATQEISRNVQRAAQGTREVSSNITDVERGVGQAGSASNQVLAAAQSLSGDSNRLKQEVGRFLDSVRAA
jgi:methyl-accepting chemotaxis protein